MRRRWKRTTAGDLVSVAIVVALWIGTYRLRVTVLGGVVPGDVQHGGVPIL